MSENSSRNQAADDDSETGEPIEALKELDQETSPSFVRVIRQKIHRRTTATQLLSFSWQLPKVVFIELAEMLAQVFSAFNNRKGDGRN